MRAYEFLHLSDSLSNLLFRLLDLRAIVSDITLIDSIALLDFLDFLIQIIHILTLLFPSWIRHLHRAELILRESELRAHPFESAFIFLLRDDLVLRLAREFTHLLRVCLLRLLQSHHLLIVLLDGYIAILKQSRELLHLNGDCVYLLLIVRHFLDSISQIDSDIQQSLLFFCHVIVVSNYLFYLCHIRRLVRVVHSLRLWQLRPFSSDGAFFLSLHRHEVRCLKLP